MRILLYFPDTISNPLRDCQRHSLISYKVQEWVNATLRQHDYEKRGRAAKGLLPRSLEKMTGYSRAQVTRWLQQ